MKIPRFSNTPDRPRSLNRHSLLPEEDFQATLEDEWRRSERSERSFVLMLATLESPATKTEQAYGLDAIVAPVKALTRATDIFGWYQQDEILGAIFTEIRNTDKNSSLVILQDKIRSAVEVKSSMRNGSQLKLSFQLFPDSNGRSPWMDRAQRTKPRAETIGRGAKRALDVAGSLLGLIILAPLLLIISLLVKLTSRGPVLFRQTRLGRYGQQFTFLKFRSMYVNNDDSQHKEYVSSFIAGKAMRNQSANRKYSGYKVIDDPRITPLGRFLRKTSIDELPQLLNVLKGEMSLVGPRPPLPYECACYSIWHTRRIIDAKPGITGLWQVCGRSRTTFDDMVRLDLRYARRWSFALDVLILLRTFIAVFSRAGAY